MKNIIKNYWKGIIYYPFNYPVRKIIPNALYGKRASLKEILRFLIGFVPILRDFFYVESVSERVVEDPFVIGEITKLKKGSNLLDFGCFSSQLPFQFASLGYRVYGVDYNNYGLTHPNLSFFEMNFLANKFKSNFFDAIYAVSSLEHVGVGWYSQEKKGITDFKVVREFKRILKPGGKLIVTVPFGEYKLKKDEKTYDNIHLDTLFKDFKLIKRDIFVKMSETCWIPLKKNSNLPQVACWVVEKNI